MPLFLLEKQIRKLPPPPEPPKPPAPPPPPPRLRKSRRVRPEQPAPNPVFPVPPPPVPIGTGQLPPAPPAPIGAAATPVRPPVPPVPQGAEPHGAGPQPADVVMGSTAAPAPVQTLAARWAEMWDDEEAPSAAQLPRPLQLPAAPAQTPPATPPIGGEWPPPSAASGRAPAGSGGGKPPEPPGGGDLPFATPQASDPKVVDQIPPGTNWASPGLPFGTPLPEAPHWKAPRTIRRVPGSA